MNKNLKQTQGGVALSLVPRSPSHNKGYEVRALQALNPNCSLWSQLLISLNVRRNREKG
jgi:hypothetical protein